jgi:beta-N-acetylhexosaminidase
MRGLTVGAEPTVEDIDRVRTLLQELDAVLLVTRNAALSQQRMQFLQVLSGSTIPVIHVAVGLPYDAGLVANAKVTLLTYGDPDVSLMALVDVLTGKAIPQGTSPVTLGSLRSDDVS